MKRTPLLALFLIFGFVLPLILAGGVLAIAGEELAPSEKALEQVPPQLLPLYRAAAETCEGLEWTVLAAVHKVETNFGTGRAVSSAGAQGPMQFMPPTFAAYGVDGDGDGKARINDLEDSVFSAARLLCANGAGQPVRLAGAIWNYNHSDAYVAEVMSLAASYGIYTVGGSASDLLNDPRVVLTANARADLEAGVVDERLVTILHALSRRHTLGISVFKAGHSMRTRSGSISNHFLGRGADIFFVDGSPVSSSNGGARAIVHALASLPDELRPTEIGHPFADLTVIGGFSDADHDGHIHVGFD